MKTLSFSLLMLLSSITMISSTGCGSDPKPTSVTEGIPLSDIEAYEKAQKAMESDSEAEMEEAAQP